MINLIVELSKFTLLTLMVCYTLHCLYLVRLQSRAQEEISTGTERVLLFAIDSIAFMVLYLKTGDQMIILLYLGMMALFTILMASMMIPFQVIMIPLFMEIFYMGLFDTLVGLVVPKFAAVIGIFFFRSFYFSLPKQLEEAGRIDGLTEFGIWLRIIVPLCKPALVTQAVLTLNSCWNDLLWPLLMTNNPENRMLPNGVLYFIGQDINDYGPTFAAGLISLVPILIIFLFGQKYFVSSIVNSGMKE